MEHLIPKFDENLKRLIQDVKLQQLSRLPASRIETTAIPNIGTIELVTAEAFEHGGFQDLYNSMFHGNERERADLITSRLRESFAGKREGLAPYHIIGIRNRNGEALCGAQFSVLMLHDENNGFSDRQFAVPYVQYIYVRTQNRRQDLSEVLHTLVLAVATAEGDRVGRVVPFTAFETEPPNHGTEQTTRTNATERTTIHTRSGAKAMMLRNRADGKILSAHVQPGLEPQDRPLTLVWVIRPSPIELRYDIDKLGHALIAAYYRSLRDEGFPEANIALAERIVAARCEGAEFFDMPLHDIEPEMHQ